MALMGGYEYLLHTSKGKRYNLYLDESKELYCIVSNEKQQWAEKNQVFPMACNNIDADLDADDQVHVVTCHRNGLVNYHRLNNGKWLTLKVFQHQPSEQIINCRIKHICGQTHIILDLHQRKKSILYHYLLKHGSDQWISNVVTEISFKKYINPLQLLVQEDNKLLILYTSLVNEYEQLFLLNYDLAKDQWNKPKQLTAINSTKLYLDCLLDQEETLHATWSEYSQDTLSVQYYNLNLKTSGGQGETKTLSERLNCSFPQLILFQDNLYLTWFHYNHLMQRMSRDQGNSWSLPHIVPLSKTKHFKRYRYISNVLKLRGQFLYGTLYPRIQFLGLGGDYHDEISDDDKSQLHSEEGNN